MNRKARAIRPIAKLKVSATVAAVGSTIFGNWTWRIRPWRPTTEFMALFTVVVNHFQGRIAANRKRRKSSVLRWKITANRK